MTLASVPIFFIVAGLCAYTVLGGADFGAGIWQLVGSRREREHAHHSMSPVWEVNHVWLIFVLVVSWTSYPEAFGSITSTLAVPFFVAGLGIVLRGTAYALRAGIVSAREQRVVEVALSSASLVTPFMLGAAVGGIASGRVPVGNADGDLVSSWLNPTSILVGSLAVVVSVYLAAVYLAADAARRGEGDLAEVYRRRALAVAGVAGALAAAGLALARSDAEEIWHGLTHGGGLAAVVASATAGVVTFGLLVRRRFGAARVTSAVAVAAVAAGWILAQRPEILPGLTIDEAAAGRATLWWVVASVVGGAVVLVPSLAFLFRLVLRGRLDHDAPEVDGPGFLERTRNVNLVPPAGALLVAGSALMLGLDASWSRIAGVLALFGFIAVSFVGLAGAVVRDE
jgi:cytochrome bd ubiquinol oxidase subunit II